MSGKRKESECGVPDPLEELYNYGTVDPVMQLNNFIKESSKSKKKKKMRIINYKTDANGNRLYPFKGQTRRKKKEVDEKSCEDHNEAFQIDIEEANQIDHNEAFQMDIEEANQIEFNDVAVEAIRTLEERIPKTEKKRAKTWKDRMETVEDAWLNEQAQLISVAKSLYQLSGTCQNCEEKGVLYCKECSLQLCSNCDLGIHHRHPLHNRSTFVKGFKKTLAPNEALDANNEIVETERFVPLQCLPCDCGSTSFSKIQNKKICFVVTLTGKFELLQYRNVCCQCNKAYDPFNLKNTIRSGFWPYSPRNFSYLFHEEVFLLWDQFSMHMPGSSENSFLQSLNALTELHGRVGKVNHTPFSKSLKNWNFVNYDLDQIQGKDWMKCPPCTIYQHSCHIDGNCKLYRYRNSGSSTRKSYYQGAFIENDNEVDSFLKTAPSCKSSDGHLDTNCGGDWSAARNVARKRKSVDYTGLEVAACRHQFGQRAVNMKRGEIFALSHYLIQKYIVPHNVTFIFADVMCKLWKYLKRVDQTITKNIKGALSVMHAKGHSLDCQAFWDGEWIEGTAKSTGEECEQLFSHLSRLGNTTKYQKPENREETITEHVLFWNKRKTMKLAETLCQKYHRVTKELSMYRAKLKKCILDFKLAEEIDFNSWLLEVRNLSSGGKTMKTSLTRCQALILLKHDLKAVPPNDISTPIRSTIENITLPDLSNLKIPLLRQNKTYKETVLEDSWVCASVDDIKSAGQEVVGNVLIPAFREAIEAYYFQQFYWKNRICKVADSAKKRSNLRTKLFQSKEKLRNLIREYGKLVDCQNKEELESGVFPWRLNEMVTGADKRAVVTTHQKISRCKEELELLKKDMESYLKFYSDKSNQLKTKIDSLDVFPDLPTLEQGEKDGHLNLLRTGLRHSDQQLMKGLRFFCTLVSPKTLIEYSIQACEFSDPDEDFLSDDENQPDQGEEEDAVGCVEDFDEILVKQVGSEIMEEFDRNNCSVIDNSGFLKICLPLGFSQGSLNGENGSNACTVIALLTGYVFSRSENLTRDRMFEEIVPAFVGCMDIGNSIHQGGDMLTVQEAQSMLRMKIAITQENNCFIGGLAQVIRNSLQESGKPQFLVLVSSDRTVCVLHPNGDNMVLFDSHQHQSMGAVIIYCSRCDLNPIINAVSINTPSDVIYHCLVTIS